MASYYIDRSIVEMWSDDEFDEAEDSEEDDGPWTQEFWKSEKDWERELDERD